MRDESHLDILARGVEAWNSWRAQDGLGVTPVLCGAYLCGADLSGAYLSKADLSEADLSEANLSGADLSDANLSGANLPRATLYGADLSRADLPGANLCGVNLSEACLPKAYLPRADFSGANLCGADLCGAYLYKADFCGADLSGGHLSQADLSDANLSGANLPRATLYEADLCGAKLCGAKLCGAKLCGADLSNADLSDADLCGANLTHTILVKTILERTTLTDCHVYGISAWSLRLEGAKQWNLKVSDFEEADVMVDNLEVAQFVYLILNNENLRQVIDTVTSKAVLILGRFTAERKVILDAIRDALRQRGYLPILFDFEKPASRDLTETISTLAHMVRFIIADVTEAKSIPQELQAIVPDLPSVPVQPLLLASDREYGMFEHFKRYPWVLDTYYYDDVHEVLTSLEDKIISPAESKASELMRGLP